MKRNPYHDGPRSDHFDGKRFFNPGQPTTDRSFRDILRWRREGARATWPAQIEVAPAKPPERVQDLSVTMVGHASVLIQLGGLNLLADPVWSHRASPLRFAGPKRVTAPGIAFEDLPPIDAVLITHNHYDHMDAATLRRLHAMHQPRMITPLGNDAVLAKAAPGVRAEAGDWGQRFELSAKIALTLHPAHHWSARGIGDRRMALWAGFVIEAPGGPVYLAGDTGYGDGAIFREVLARFGPPRLAILPIGAYEPRWFMRDQHANPDEAVRMMRDCGARQALGVHWGTFQLTDEARLAPVEALHAACRQQGIAPGRFAAFSPGEVWTPDEPGSPARPV